MSIQNFRDKSISVSISSSQGSPTSSAEKIQLFEPHSITLTSTTVHPAKIPSEQSPLLSCKDPVDKYNAAWIIFLILGTGSLLPWTAAINAADYYMTIYHFFPEFMFFLALANNYSSLVLAPIVLKIMPRFPYAPRVVISYLSYFAMVAITPFLILLFDPVRAVYFTYATVFVCGMTTSVLMGTLFGLVALYPPKYASAMMSGLGFAGVLTSALRILTKSVFPHTAEGLQHSAEVYFIATAVVFLICIICYFILLRLPVTKYHVHNFREAQASSRRFNSARHLPEDISLRAVLKKVSREQFTVFGSFFITLALFPGITGLIVPTAKISADWFRLIITSIFNFGEFFGRFIPRWYVACSQFSLPYAAVTRVVFLIIFPLCIKPVLIANDYVIYVILAIFAISNGYFSTLGMMFGPTRVHCEERESAGMILAFGMNLGVLCGSHFAFLILYLLTGAVV